MLRIFMSEKIQWLRPGLNPQTWVPEASMLKGKGKGRLWVLQHCCLEAYCTLTRMSSFIHLQRRCTHQAASETSASEGRNYTWNLASNP